MFFHKSLKRGKNTSYGADVFFHNFLIMGWLFFFIILDFNLTCAEIESESNDKLSKPELVLVYDFAVSPDEVKLDRGISPKVLDAARGTPKTVEELKVGHAFANALAKELVRRIQKLGLPAERAAGIPPEFPNTLLIEGQITSIDESNRTESIAIGFSTGRKDVKIHVQVYEMTAESLQKLKELKAKAWRGRKQEMHEMMGVGASLTDGVMVPFALVASVSIWDEASWETVEDDAKKIAKDVAKELSLYFIKKGWISE